MGKPVSRITDEGSHGGFIITGAAKTVCENQKVARIGDIYDCAVHGPNKIITGAPKYIVEGKRCARIGSLTECGATIITGARKAVCD